jgi:hypothetical protein
VPDGQERGSRARTPAVAHVVLGGYGGPQFFSWLRSHPMIICAGSTRGMAMRREA